MKTIIEIPTYAITQGVEHQIYDHPLPFNEECNLLGRLLDSLSLTDLKDTPILILPTSFSPQTEEKRRRFVANYDLDIEVLTEDRLGKLKRCISGYSPELSENIGVSGYSHRKNIGLLLGAMEGAENIIFLDDDEIVEDKDFLMKATEFVGKRYGGEVVDGIAGYYINPETGSYKVEESVPWARYYWKKEKKMNEAFSIIDSKERLNKTTIALGGNMVINRRLFTQVPFDPWITRGEDVDYLLNAGHFGFRFLLDRELNIKHLPPKPSVPWCTLMRRDIYRFFYEREKLLRWGLSAASLDSYPGFFVRKDLDTRMFITSLLLTIDLLSKAQWEEAIECLRNIWHLPRAKRYAKRDVERYETFREEWASFMSEYTR
jgi:hypothetical protein